MDSKISDFQRYISDEFGITENVVDAYYVKTGFIRIKLNDEFVNSLTSNSDRNTITTYLKYLYDALEKSPNVMELTPSKNKLLESLDFPMFLRQWWGENLESLSINQYLKFRVALPKKKCEELFKPFFEVSWNPEQFTIYFNGALFFTSVQIEDIPFYTEIGCITREFLVESLNSIEIWEYEDGFGPTPIHPDFYFFIVSSNENDTSRKYPSIKMDRNNNIIVILPDEISFDYFIENFIDEITMALEDFYTCIILRSKLLNIIGVTIEKNNDLRKLLSEYFNQSWLQRLFSMTTKKIRKTLSEMHILLLEISSTELMLKHNKNEAIESINNSIFLTQIVDYFKNHIKANHDFDRNAILTEMNFASDETSNNVLNQFTLFAAFLGALIGGIITMFSQILIK